MPDFLRNRRRNATHLRPRASLVMRVCDTLMVLRTAINVYPELTVTGPLPQRGRWLRKPLYRLTKSDEEKQIRESLSLSLKTDWRK